MEHPVSPAPPAAVRRFAMPRRESRVVAWVTRAVIIVACLNILLFSWSIYRRIFQVLRLDVRVSSAILTSATTISADVITTGEVPNPMRLELIQGSHTEILWEARGGMPMVRSFDPRLFRYTPSISVTSELLGRFSPGPATLRLTGVGMQKLLRTPAPRIRELQVMLPRR